MEEQERFAAGRHIATRLPGAGRLQAAGDGGGIKRCQHSAIAQYVNLLNFGVAAGEVRQPQLVHQVGTTVRASKRDGRVVHTHQQRRHLVGGEARNIDCQQTGKQQNEPSKSHHLPHRITSLRSLPGLWQIRRPVAIAPARTDWRPAIPARSQARHHRVAAKIHVGAILVARLMIAMRHVIGGLLQSPLHVVALILAAFVHGKRRHAKRAKLKWSER